MMNKTEIYAVAQAKEQFNEPSGSQAVPSETLSDDQRAPTPAITAGPTHQPPTKGEYPDGTAPTPTCDCRRIGEALLDGHPNPESMYEWKEIHGHFPGCPIGSQVIPRHKRLDGPAPTPRTVERNNGIEPDPDGVFVFYEDYTALITEAADLRRQLEEAQAQFRFEHEDQRGLAALLEFQRKRAETAERQLEEERVREGMR